MWKLIQLRHVKLKRMYQSEEVRSLLHNCISTVCYFRMGGYKPEVSVDFLIGRYVCAILIKMALLIQRYLEEFQGYLDTEPDTYLAQLSICESFLMLITVTQLLLSYVPACMHSLVQRRHDSVHPNYLAISKQSPYMQRRRWIGNSCRASRLSHAIKHFDSE